MIKIYGKQNCKYCELAFGLVMNRGVEFEYIDVSVDIDALAMIKRDGFTTVPAIYKNDTKIGGYDDYLNYI